jgi:hypothetical protein
MDVIGRCGRASLVVLEPGTTGQLGFASVASGRLAGTQLDLEWADVPLGNILGAGDLTFVYDQGGDRLTLREQRGDWEPFGGTVLTRIGPEPSTEPSMGASEALVVDQGNSKVADSARARISSMVSGGVSGRYIASMITIEPSTSTIQKSSIWPGPW